MPAPNIRRSHTVMRPTLKRACALVLLLLTPLALGGCIVVQHPRPGYCYYHPYRC